MAYFGPATRERVELHRLTTWHENGASHFLVWERYFQHVVVGPRTQCHAYTRAIHCSLATWVCESILIGESSSLSKTYRCQQGVFRPTHNNLIGFDLAYCSFVHSLSIHIRQKACLKMKTFPLLWAHPSLVLVWALF